MGRPDLHRASAAHGPMSRSAGVGIQFSRCKDAGAAAQYSRPSRYDMDGTLTGSKTLKHQVQQAANFQTRGVTQAPAVIILPENNVIRAALANKEQAARAAPVHD